VSIDINISLEVKTCCCGTIFAVPHWVQHWRCPLCAQRRLDAMAGEIEELSERVLERDRSISALKGAITKLKGGDGRG
jgi:hypothetical protein